MMKILQLSNKVPYPPRDGGAIGIFNFSIGFSMLGHDITLLSINTSKHFCDISSIPEEIRRSVKIIGVFVNTRIRMDKLLVNLFFSRIPYNAQRFISKKYEEELIRILRSNSFDVIQVEGLYMAPYIPVIRQYSNALIAFRSHNIEHEIWQRTAANARGLKKMYYTILSRRILKLKSVILNTYDVITAVTERDIQFYTKIGNTKPAKVVPAGIDIRLLVPDSTKTEYPSLFHLGALDWTPNQEGLFWFIKNVWIPFSEKYPDIKFYIAGRNAPADFVNKIRSRNVEYLGEVENAYEFMNSKAVMIVPLLSGSGMRIKIIEGMAMGKTIVSTTIGTEGILTQHHINILIADNPQQFLNEIEKIVQNVEFFKEIGKNAITFVKENFDIIAIASDQIHFFNEHLK